MRIASTDNFLNANNSKANPTTRIGRYRLLELLGKGAIGEVYRALDPDLNREVAVKIITRPGTLGLDELHRRFRQEVQLAAQLNHTHIITVYDVGLDHNPPYLVTELLSGGTLKTYLEQRTLSWQETLTLLLPICEALAYAHEAGIIHRDVKPDNLMFAGQLPHELTLVDFGLAHRGGTDQLSQNDSITGTIAYMSPEQANGRAVDARTDIFVLGLIMFEAIAGYNPQQGMTIGHTLANAISFAPIDLFNLSEIVPPPVTAFLRRALAKEQRHRYGDCWHMVQDINRCLNQPLDADDSVWSIANITSETLAVPADSTRLKAV